MCMGSPSVEVPLRGNIIQQDKGNGDFQADCTRQVGVPSKWCWKGHSDRQALSKMALKDSDIARPVMINYRTKKLLGLGLCRDASHVQQVIAVFLFIYSLYRLVVWGLLQILTWKYILFFKRSGSVNKAHIYRDLMSWGTRTLLCFLQPQVTILQGTTF